jgi:hypothetical protein
LVDALLNLVTQRKRPYAVRTKCPDGNQKQIVNPKTLNPGELPENSSAIIQSVILAP